MLYTLKCLEKKSVCNLLGNKYLKDRIGGYRMEKRATKYANNKIKDCRCLVKSSFIFAIYFKLYNKILIWGCY